MPPPITSTARIPRASTGDTTETASKSRPPLAPSALNRPAEARPRTTLSKPIAGNPLVASRKSTAPPHKRAPRPSMIDSDGGDASAEHVSAGAPPNAIAKASAGRKSMLPPPRKNVTISSPPHAANRSRMPGASSSVFNPSSSVGGNSRVAALARSHASAHSRQTTGADVVGAALGMDMAAAAAAVEARINVDSTSFENWMKMATDNKINATNTWSFALIDYFHDMSLLKSDTGDGTINFQKASCTLDGCVKVWTSRVDSVVVETGKLLSGLQDEVNAATRKVRGDGVDGAEDDEDGDGDDADGVENKKSRKKNRNKEVTLAKSFAALAVKKLDLEFTVDPLFKKTSADFDEGGAGGLLMNHLGVDGQMRVVFDAGDTAAMEDNGEGDGGAAAAEMASEAVDLSALRSKLFFAAGVGAGSTTPLASILQTRVICPTLASFRFAKDDNTPFGEEVPQGACDLQDFGELRDTLDGGSSIDYTALGGSQDPELGAGLDEIPPLQHGMDFDDFDGPDDFGGDMPDMDFFNDGGAEGPGNDFQQGGDMDLGGGDGLSMAASSSNGPNTRDLLAAMAAPAGGGLGFTTEDADGDQAAETDDNFFDYFDRRLVKGWAGPDHWKMNKVLGTIGGNDASKDAAPPKPKAKRTAKEAFTISFELDPAKLSTRDIFTAPTKPSSIQQSKAQLKKGDDHIVPHDLHFGSKQLLRLFIKPRAVINIRKRRAPSGQFGAAAASLGVDGRFWAEAAAPHSMGVQQLASDDNDFSLGDMDDGGDGGGGDFLANYLQDVHDGFGDLDDLPEQHMGGGHGGYGDPEMDIDDDDLAAAALTRIRPEYVNYAKKAKRVDIRKLKDSIWTELGIQREEDSESEPSSDTPSEPRTPPSSGAKSASGPQPFSSVLQGLRRSYSKDKLDELSTSFCFICILHLANEEGLTLDTNAGVSAAKRLGGASLSALDVDVEGQDALGLSRKGAGGKAMMQSEADDCLSDDDDWEGEEPEDEVQVGKLERLLIAKDPNAGRSA